jgi:hypothetical protein
LARSAATDGFSAMMRDFIRLRAVTGRGGRFQGLLF